MASDCVAGLLGRCPILLYSELNGELQRVGLGTIPHLGGYRDTAGRLTGGKAVVAIGKQEAPVFDPENGDWGKLIDYRGKPLHLLGVEMPAWIDHRLPEDLFDGDFHHCSIIQMVGQRGGNLRAVIAAVSPRRIMRTAN